MASIGTWKGEPCLNVGGRRFCALAGEVHNSTSSDSAWMEAAWKRADKLGITTLAVPVTWELLEPEEGTFDFSQTDSLIVQARAHKGHLILLWFGTWKNAQGFYAPEWVKRDLDRFWRAEPERGKRQIVLERYHATYGTFSALCDETAQADACAFAALMAHLCETDSAEETVVAIQVENECGLLGVAREHSELADTLFEAEQVPERLLAALKEKRELLPDDVRAAVDASGRGSWQETFGETVVADELFQAWHTASFVERIASAGKKAYPLPLLANCWLDKGNPAGRYPSGGPVARMLPVWQTAAPSIDMVCPDIYVPGFCDVLDAYHRGGNPAGIVETATHSHLGPRAIWSVCHHHALVFAPFGFEELGEPFTAMQGFLFGMDTKDPALSRPQDPEDYRKTMVYLQELLDLEEALGDRAGALDAAISERGLSQTLSFGGAQLEVRFEEGIPGAAAILSIRQAEDPSVAEAYILGCSASLSFASGSPELPFEEVLSFEEGEAPCGQWQRARRLNGDELQLLSCEAPTLLKARIHLFG